jgi:phosphate transport system substrate-binding protein
MKILSVSLAMAFLLTAGLAEGRDRIHIVGSTEVMPLIEPVAENFARITTHPAPILEPTGSGGGFRLFCENVGFETPDVIATLRPITSAELAECRSSGIAEITEIVIGSEAVVLASAAGDRPYDFTTAQLFLAAAERVPVNGSWLVNPHVRWNEIDSELPAREIKLIAPPPTTGAYYAVMDQVFVAGCRQFQEADALSETERHKICRTLRRDGSFVEGLRSEMRVIEWLLDNQGGFGFVSFSQLGHNPEQLSAHLVNGVAPTHENLISGRYPLLRPVYLYVKTQHVESVPGLQQLLYEVTSEHAIGPEGYLTEHGMIPLEDRRRNRARDMAISLQPLSR